MKKLRAYLVSTILVLAWAMPTAMVAPHVAYAQAASCVVSGGRIIIIGGKAICFPPASNACPVTVGTLTLAPVVTRSSGISPLLVFFDATGSTDTATLGGANTVFQDVNFAWTFGDSSSISGSGATWMFGSNAGVNSRNNATGGIAAHLYITSGIDTTYNIQAVAFDGTNTASCNLSVTAFDPSGTNGFPGTATTCVAATTTPVAGSGGCPAGAAVLQSSSLTTATSTSNLGAGKRVLLNCGDTFAGTTRALGANPATTAGGVAGTPTSPWSLGAYGICPNTQSGRPILSGEVVVDLAAVDGRITDLDFEGPGVNSGTVALSIGPDFLPPAIAATQITIYNTLSNGNDESHYCSECTQSGLIQAVQTGMGTNQGTFWNFGENDCTNGSAVFNCGGTPSFVNNNYNAILGGSFSGAGAPGGSGIETIRISGGSKWVIENIITENSNNAGTGLGSTLKLHSGNTKSSNCEWIGDTGQFIEISDNLLTGTSGAEIADWTSQAPTKDERLQFLVAERNIFSPSTSGHSLLLGVMNATLRNNVFKNSGTSIGQRGFQGTSNNTSGTDCSGTGTTAAPVIALYPQFNEDYNNTCDGGGCIAYSGSNGNTAAANNSFAQNNITFGSSAVSNSGSGNTITNNSPTTTANPGFTNGSGSLSIISDFKPTANFTISCTPFPSCTAVPNFFDALGVAWSPTWDLGAVHH
jgi:hypothetical protein